MGNKDNEYRRVFLQAAGIMTASTLIAACAPKPIQNFVTETPTILATPEPSPTQTQIPPTDTPVPTQVPPTETPEIKQFKDCEAKNYTECYIEPEDLLNGNYYEYIKKTKSRPFTTPPDFSKVIWAGDDESMMFAGKLGFSLTNPAAPTLHMGDTFGWTRAIVTDPSRGGTFGEDFIVRWVEFAIPGKPDETDIGVFLQEKIPGFSEQIWLSLMKNSKRNGALLIAGFNSSKVNNNLSIEMLKRHPDMPERIAKFEQTKDATYICGPGIVLISPFLR